jgi:hypothetical protein
LESTIGLQLASFKYLHTWTVMHMVVAGSCMTVIKKEMVMAKHITIEYCQV